MSEKNKKKLLKIITWIAYIWAVVSVLFILLMIVGHIFNPDDLVPTPIEWLGLIIFPTGVIAGNALGMLKKRIGGLITVICLVAFYIYIYLLRGFLPPGPVFVLVAMPGILFLILSFYNKK